MIFGKKTIVLTTLVFALGLAIYLNWQFATNTDGFAMTGKPTGTEQQSSSSKNFGDASFVSGSSVDASTTFTEARLTRQKTRDEAIATMKNVLSSTSMSQDEIDKAVSSASKIAENIEKENTMETLIKAKGFKDCMVTIDGESVIAMVQTDGLLPSEAAQIKDVIVTVTKAAGENIRVNEVK